MNELAKPDTPKASPRLPLILKTGLWIAALAGGGYILVKLVGAISKTADEMFQRFVDSVWTPASTPERFIIAGIAVIVVMLLVNWLDSSGANKTKS